MTVGRSEGWLDGLKRRLLEMQREFGRLFGRNVDLTTRGSLSKYFREDVVASAHVPYDAA